MDTERLVRVWLSLLVDLETLQAGGVKIKAAIEGIKAQAPKDKAVQLLMARLLADDGKDEPWAMIPP
jgi:hypothetical protein